MIKIIKKDCKNRSHERYQSLSKEKKEKRNNMATKDTKIYQKIKHKSWMSTEEDIIE